MVFGSWWRTLLQTPPQLCGRGYHQLPDRGTPAGILSAKQIVESNVIVAPNCHCVCDERGSGLGSSREVESRIFWICRALDVVYVSSRRCRLRPIVFFSGSVSCLCRRDIVYSMLVTLVDTILFSRVGCLLRYPSLKFTFPRFPKAQQPKQQNKLQSYNDAQFWNSAFLSNVNSRTRLTLMLG